MAMVDTLTTREAVRRATAHDIIARCDLAAVSMEGGPLDGLPVVSMGVLRDQVAASLGVKLDPPPDTVAEVKTPSTITVSTICPECGLPTEIVVKLAPQLTVTNDGAELSVKAKAKARVHVHNQLALPEEADGQLGLDDVVIEDLRIRILTAIDDLATEHAAEANPGPPVSLEAIAGRLELATDHARGDLEESLYRYSQLEPPLVSIDDTDRPIVYALTDAGAALLEVDADQDDDGEATP